MAELIVLGFPRMETADKIVPELAVLNREGLIDLADWARVIRHEDGRVDERQGTCTTSAGAVSGALWGMLFGLLILSPIAGALIGSVTGALIGKQVDYGIDDRFIKEIGNQITPGTSALFLCATRATPDKVIDRLRPYQPTLIHTSLSEQAEHRLREAMQGGVAA